MIFHFKPAYQTYLWGGARIQSLYDRPDAPRMVAESWEISDRPEGMSRTHSGQTLADLVANMGKDLVGWECPRFPLLIKLIDAREHLSVQVHPCDVTASLLQAEAKTEAWFALQPSSVYLGLKAHQSLSFEPQALNHLTLNAGDIAYVPGGTIHAICAGSLLLEVQQNSNTTYRLYDWGRGRPLHLTEGLRAIHPDSRPLIQKSPLTSPYFHIQTVSVDSTREIKTNPKTFQIFFCAAGSGEIVADRQKKPLYPGKTVLVAAKTRKIELRGSLQLVQIHAGIN